MNTNQKRVLITGLLLVTQFVVFNPIRYQNPFYLPMIESMSALSGQAIPTDLSAPDIEKNKIAAGIVLLATLIGLYGLRDKHGAHLQRTHSL